VRRDLLKFGVDIAAEARFTRLDSGASVLVDYHPEAVPPSPELPPLMARVVGGVADEAERATFGQLWQDGCAASCCRNRTHRRWFCVPTELEQ
jgi:hypothetical protein